MLPVALAAGALGAGQTMMKLAPAIWNAVPSKDERLLNKYYRGELAGLRGAEGGMSAGQRQQFIGEATGQVQGQQAAQNAMLNRGGGADLSGVRSSRLADLNRQAMGASQQAMSGIRSQDIALAQQRRAMATQGLTGLAGLAQARRQGSAQMMQGAAPTTSDLLGNNNQGWWGFGQQVGTGARGIATQSLTTAGPE